VTLGKQKLVSTKMNAGWTPDYSNIVVKRIIRAEMLPLACHFYVRVFESFTLNSKCDVSYSYNWYKPVRLSALASRHVEDNVARWD
jgi:hypothetical protein